MRFKKVYISKRLFRLSFIAFFVISLIVLTTKSTNKYLLKQPEPPLIIRKDRILNTFPIPNSTYNIMDDMGDSFDDDKIGERPKACFITLVRNQEMDDMVESIGYIREKFNKNYNYPWVFLNDEEFTDEFKENIHRAVGNTTVVEFGLVPTEHWSYPDYIDQDKAAETRVRMADIIYGDSESYRNMCRYQSGFFWRHELLDKYDWYWRVEPGIKYFCDIPDDPFQFMQDNKKVYGFTITIHEFEATIQSLWQTTIDFVGNNTEYIASDNLVDFISYDNGLSYNLCHFWSNFEIGNLNFWRSKAYRAYFDYLDHAGGFFYERWGDAPVHSIAASLFLPRDAIHFFPEISYYHVPYTNCPIDDNIFKEYNCECNPDDDFTWQDYSCGVQYHDAQNITKPAGWEEHRG